jgi:hypothetical protein
MMQHLMLQQVKPVRATQSADGTMREISASTLLMQVFQLELF